MTISVSVPATSANLGPGFDSFGIAMGLYDDVSATIADGSCRVSVTGVAADVAQDLVTGGSDLDRIAFLAQAALAMLALGTLFLPSLRAWLRNPGS